MRRVFVSGAFDMGGSTQLRFLQEAARLGPVTLALWPDESIRSILGRPPEMGLAERLYYFEALSYVAEVEVVPVGFDPNRLPIRARQAVAAEGEVWAVCSAIGSEAEAPSEPKLSWCLSRGIELREISSSSLAGFPYEAPPVGTPRVPGLKRVIVTGCYDYLHTGHLRFFEEASAYGELNVIIGSDANVRLLKGEGHPLFSQAERGYVVGSFRRVARCLVASGSGWLDAEPEIRALRAERYVVNEDGDKIEKRRYCEERGIEYIVLERRPKEGLPKRTSTELRGY